MGILRNLSLAALVALAAPLSGCIVTTEAPPPDTHSSGTLTIAFTIEGTIDPALCDFYGASDAELVVYDSRGVEVEEREAPCSAFEVSAELYPGRYEADITLVDAIDRAVSVTKPLEALDVLDDMELVVDVDFPVDSML